LRGRGAALTENRGEPWQCALTPGASFDAGEGVIAFVGENGRPRKPTFPPRGSRASSTSLIELARAGTSAAGRSYRKLQAGRGAFSIAFAHEGAAPDRDPRSVSTSAPLI